MTPRKYELVLTRSQRWSLYAPAAMFMVMPVLVLVLLQLTPEASEFRDNAPPFFPWFPFGVFVLWGMVWISPAVTLPRTIFVSSGDVLRFTSPLRTVEIRAADVLSVEPSSLRWAQVPLTTYLLKHRHGRLRFPGQFTGQHQLISELKQKYPIVELKGC